jgi:hypothetical protein
MSTCETHLTQRNEIVQDPASIGTALKTISMRIRANVFIALAL